MEVSMKWGLPKNWCETIWSAITRPKIAHFACALPSKVFPWGLGSSTLGFLIPDGPSVVSLNHFCIFSGFVNVLRITGTGFMIFSSPLGPNHFHGTWSCWVIPPEFPESTPRFGISSGWKYCFLYGKIEMLFFSHTAFWMLTLQCTLKYVFATMLLCRYRCKLTKLLTYSSYSITGAMLLALLPEYL